MNSSQNTSDPFWEQSESRRLEFKEKFPKGTQVAREERISNHIFSQCAPIIIPEIYIQAVEGKNLLKVCGHSIVLQFLSNPFKAGS